MSYYYVHIVDAGVRVHSVCKETIQHAEAMYII